MDYELSGATQAAWWQPTVRTAAVVVPFLTCAVLATVRDQVTRETAVLLLVLWVVAAAATGDRVSGVAAAVSGGAWFDFFLTRPYQTFTINDADDVEATVLLVVISLVVTEVALWGRRQQAAASRRSGYLGGVVDVAGSVAEGGTPRQMVIDVVARQITDVLGADECRFVPEPVRDPRIAILDHEGVLTRNGHAVDVERVGLPSDEYVAVPVRRGSQTVGHFLVTATSHISRPDREQRRVAVLLADQVAVAIEDESA
jgi:K+-sensing histidine kinase KdpD